MRHCCARLGALLCMIGLAFSVQAQGFVPDDTIYVAPVSPGTLGVPDYVAGELQEAVDEAVQRSREEGMRVRVLIEGNGNEPYTTDTVYIPADAFVHIIGYTPYSGSRPNSRPWEVILDGGADPSNQSGVINIHNNPAPAIGEPFIGDEAVDRVRLEGLMVRNSVYGVRVQAQPKVAPGDPDPDPIRPTFNRCIFYGSGDGSGTQVENACARVDGIAEPLFVNCAMGGYITPADVFDPSVPANYNSLTGVLVTGDANATSVYSTEILHCSILMNEDYGVLVRQGANANVRNTILYRNGDGFNQNVGLPEEGGLVWEDNSITISPREAPFDTPESGVGSVEVTIRGRGLFIGDRGDQTRVFFGPPDREEETEWTYNSHVAGDIQELRGNIPPSYLGAPGPVDVYIDREDGFGQIIKLGFLYTQETAVPEVTQVIPESGLAVPVNAMDPTERRGQWVHVYGARFEENCEVWFDTDDDDNLITVLDHQSERVQWLSSSLLYVKVPEVPFATGKIDVFVRNPGSSPPGTVQDSPVGNMEEYEFLAAPGQPRPSISEVLPNVYRDLQATPSGSNVSRRLTVDIVGWNFGPGTEQRQDATGAVRTYPQAVTVKIGGIVCPYREIIPVDESGVNGIYQGVNDANGDSFDEVRDVEVPVAAFGTGGSYDVEIINEDGMRAVLPNGFTYYGSGVPQFDIRTVGGVTTEWRPANFPVADLERTLLGSGFDTTLDIIFESGAEPAVQLLNLLPDQSFGQHIRHTQRAIEFNDIPRFGGPPRTVDVSVENVSSVNGGASAAASGIKLLETEFHLPDVGGVFQVQQVEMLNPWPGDESVPGAYYAQARVTGWQDGMELYLNDVAVDYVDDAAPPNIGFHVLPSTLRHESNATIGPADVTVLWPGSAATNASNRDLYYVAEDAAWIPRMADVNSDGVLDYSPPKVYGATPRRVSVTGGQTITIQGADFVGPYDPANGWVYTVVMLEDPTAGIPPVPVFAPADYTLLPALETYLTGAGIATNYPDAVTSYEVKDDGNIELQFGDLTAHSVFSTFTVNTPLNLHVMHVLADGTPLTASDGATLLTSSINDAIALVTAANQPPIVTDVFRWGTYDPYPPGGEVPLVPDLETPADFGLTLNSADGQRFGTVRGGDVLVIRGSGFSSATGTTYVRIGGAEARILQNGDQYTDNEGNIIGDALQPSGDPFWTTPAYNADTTLYVVTPPAPQGLPGTFDVTVQVEKNNWFLEGRAPQDQQFTYIMDGAPVITEVRPNFVDRNQTDDDEGDAVYITLYGYNFDDVVDVIFEVGSTVVEKEHFSVSPYEIVVEAPSALTDLDLNVLHFTATPIIDVDVSVRNRATEIGNEIRDDDDALTSNTVTVHYYDTATPVEPLQPTLAFNDVYLNAQDYVNVQPGQGSLSVDPLFDPGSELIHTPGPKAITVVTLGDPRDWWLGKLARRGIFDQTGTLVPDPTADNPMRDKAGDFKAEPFTSEDLELQSRPNVANIDVDGIPDTQGSGAVEGARADIGADEIQIGGVSDVVWYECDIPEYIGAVDEEQLDVTIRIRGLLGSLMADRDAADPDDPGPDGRIFLVPQGGDPTNANHRIPLKITTQLSNTTYFCTNAEAITTLVYSPDGANPDGTLKQGDIVADGHAAVYIYIPAFLGGADEFILGYPESDFDDNNLIDDLTHDGGIVSPASYDRHVVIDTIPPRIFLESYFNKGTVDEPLYVARPLDLLGSTNDTYNIEDWDVVAPSNHADLPLPGQSNEVDLRMFANTPYEWHEDNNDPLESGGIEDRFTVTGTRGKESEKAQLFFNVGSVSSGLPTEDLDITLNVRYVDPHVAVSGQRPALYPGNGVIAGEVDTGPTVGANRDVYTRGADDLPLDTREVSGFADQTSILSTTDTAELTNSFAQAQWVFDEGETVFQNAAPAITGTFTALDAPSVTFDASQIEVAQNLSVSGDVVANTGFSRINPSVSADYGNNVLEAEWAITGLDWNTAHNDTFKLAVRFSARDRAGNVTEETRLLEPLYLWWGLEVQTEISENSLAEQPAYKWELNRGVSGGPNTLPEPEIGTNTSVGNGPAPAFTWRLYVSQDGTNPDGIYFPAGPFQPWSPNNDVNREQMESLLRNGGWYPDDNEYYCMLVVLGTDEAGNVEPWHHQVPYWDAEAGEPLFNDSDVPVDFTDSVLGVRRSTWADDLPNVFRFPWSGKKPPETRVNPNFYYDYNPPSIGEDLGSNLYIPKPEGVSVDSRFDVEAVYTDRTNLRYVWRIYEEGSEAVFASSDDQSEDPLWNEPVVVVKNLGDPDRRREITYIFEAAAYVDSNGNRRYDGFRTTYTGVPLAGERVDPTPASVTFTVTPFGVEPKKDPGEQPIMIREEQ